MGTAGWLLAVVGLSLRRDCGAVGGAGRRVALRDLRDEPAVVVRSARACVGLGRIGLALAGRLAGIRGLVLVGGRVALGARVRVLGQNARRRDGEADGGGEPDPEDP